MDVVQRLFHGIETMQDGYDIHSALQSSSLDVNTEDPCGRSVLAFALLHHAVDIASYLIQNGANLDTTSKNGHTPLTEISRQGGIYSTELVFLVTKGANVNQAADCGHTPLMLATMANNIPHITVLIEQGADPDACTEDFPPPMEYAIVWKHFSALCRLLEMGAFTEQTWMSQETPLLQCLRHHPQPQDMDIYMPMFWHAGADIDAFDGTFSPFLRTIINGNIHWARDLLEHGCSIHHQQRIPLPRELANALDMLHDTGTSDELNHLFFASGEQFDIDLHTMLLCHAIVFQMNRERTHFTLLSIVRTNIRAHLVKSGINLLHQVMQLPITHIAKDILLYKDVVDW